MSERLSVRRDGSGSVRDRLLGSWTLRRAETMSDGLVVDSAPFGHRPDGVIHYLPNGCMAALIAPDPSLPAAFMAYGGTYTALPDRVIHHVRINSRRQDVGADYVRMVSWDDDGLWLATPDPPDPGQRAMRLFWRRLDR